MKLDIPSLLLGYRAGTVQPIDVIAEVYRRIRARGERPVWIELVPEEQALEQARSLGPFREDLRLYGIPFAIKDNIDLAGIPTTAACPDYAYAPDQSATVIDRLIAAGAIPVAAGSIIDRSGGAADLGIPRAALETLTVPVFEAADCPMCLKGEPVSKPGSRPV